MKKVLAKYKLHVFIWVIFMAYETLLVSLLFNVEGALAVYAVHYVVTIFLFYLTGDYLLPWVIKRRDKLIFGFLLFICYILVYIALHFLANVFLMFTGLSHYVPNYGFNKDFILRNFYRGVYFGGFATGYSFIKNYFQELERAEKLEKEKLLNIIHQQKTEQELMFAQHAFLKAQINPHFLFNTLDFVYHKVNMHSPVAGEAVVRLSQMMRHAISTDEMHEFVSLADEIEHVENLIYLYQVRKNEALNLQFHYQSQVLELRLIPLILLTLVENIFKHGELSNTNETATISIGISHNYFFIETSNSISPTKSLVSNGYGLENIEKRLLHAYGNEIRFEYGENLARHFTVSLAIPIHQLKALSGSVTSSPDSDK